jgi:hypothetical protein
VRPLTKGARKRAVRAVEDLGIPGEEIIEVDGGRSVTSKRRWDFVATDVALYVYDPRTHVTNRFPYDQLAAVWADARDNARGYYPGNLEFVDRPTAARFAFYDVTLSNGVLPRYVEAACANYGGATHDE